MAYAQIGEDAIETSVIIRKVVHVADLTLDINTVVFGTLPKTVDCILRRIQRRHLETVSGEQDGMPPQAASEVK